MTDGSQEITPATMTLTAESYTGIYDAEGHGITVTPGVTEGTTLSYSTDNGATWTTEAPTWTDVTGEAKTVQVKAENPNYEDATASATVTITPAPLTVTTESGNKSYDGTPLTAPGELTGLVGGETATFTVTGSQTEVGDSENTYTLTFDGTAKESNYEVTSESLGTLVVTESTAEIVVTTTGGTFTYNGQPHGATVSVGTLPDGYTVQTAASTATATDVTTTPVPATADQLVIVNAAGEDVTSKLNITYVDGTIEVTPLDVTVIISGHTGTLPYNGSEQSVAGYDITSISSELRAEELGTLEVTPRAVTVTIVGNTNTVMYNGTQQSVTGYTTTISDPLFNASYIRHTGGSTASGTAVGTYAMGLSADQFTSTNPNFDVTFQVTDGQLTITPAPTPATPIGGGGTITPTPGDPTPTDPTPTDPTPTPAPTPTNVTPAPTTNIAGNATPLAGLGRGIWSLFDLLATLLTVLLSLILLPGLFRRKKDDEEEEDEQAQGDAVMAAQASAAKKDEDEEKNYKMHKPLRVLSLIPAIGSVLLFLFTQDLTLPMAIFDNWSLWFAIIALVQIVVAFFARKKKDDEDDEDENEQMTEPVFIPEA